MRRCAPIKAAPTYPGNLRAMSSDPTGPPQRPTPARARGQGARKPGPARPASVRETRVASGGATEKERTGKPPSARSLTRTSQADVGPGAEVTALTLRSLDPPRTVRVLGAGGSAAPGAVPILLLGFWAVGSEEPEPEREVWAVARSLTELSSRALEALWARSVVPKPRDMTPPPPQRPRRRGGRGGRGGTGRRGGR